MTALYLRHIVMVLVLTGGVAALRWLEKARPQPVAVLGIPAGIFYWTLVAAVLATTVAALLNWRCPACGIWLGKNLYPRFCYRCGARFR